MTLPPLHTEDNGGGGGGVQMEYSRMCTGTVRKTNFIL